MLHVHLLVAAANGVTLRRMKSFLRLFGEAIDIHIYTATGARFRPSGIAIWPLPCQEGRTAADIETEKESAAIKSLDRVQSGMLVGIGSGQTAAFLIRELGRKIRRGELYVNVVVTSQHSTDLAESGPGLVLNKVGSGALLTEKILAYNSERVIIVADSFKPV